MSRNTPSKLRNAPPRLALEGIIKCFGTVEALRNATMRVRSGTVHALLGENGAGKSTLMRIVFGLEQADGGDVRVDGVPVSWRNPSDAVSAGVGMVHQHFTLVPSMTVAENVALAAKGPVTSAVNRDRVDAITRRLGWTLPPDARVEDLPVAAQQRTEIAKALARDASLLILDEPTAALAPDDARELLSAVRMFVESGGTAIIVTHKLREALSVADDVTVLRHGRTMITGPVAAADERALARAMLGTERSRTERARSIAAPGAVVLHARDLVLTDVVGREMLRDVQLEVRAGELVGIAAVEGAGQHELLRTLAGLHQPAAGGISHPREVAFIPEDRIRDAILSASTLTENIALRGAGARNGRMAWSDLRARTAELMTGYDVRAREPEVIASTLSGGNQQKLVLARELADDPLAIVAENPTRGLDIAAADAITTRLLAARDRGAAVVMYSTDLDELLTVADRVVVLHGGGAREVTLDRESIGRAMLGL